MDASHIDEAVVLPSEIEAGLGDSGLQGGVGKLPRPSIYPLLDRKYP